MCKIICRHNSINVKMKIKSIIIAAAALILPLAANAQSQAQSAHASAHANRAHIAKATTATDRARIDHFLENEVSNRESSISGLSAQSSKMVDDLLKEANKHIGKKYVHGSKGPNTFDCSGFTSYVYKQFGYKISGASRVQAGDGVPVAKGDLRKGDLVFFTSPRSGGNVGHVGIVVSADNNTGRFKFIHASLSGVKISENTGYYAKAYLRARRVITE